MRNAILSAAAVFAAIALLLMGGLHVGRTGPLPQALDGAAANGEAAYARAAEAVSLIEWSPELERQVAALMLGGPVDRESLEKAVAAARPAFPALEEAASAPRWTAPEDRAARATRSEWEAAVWLMHGEARLLLMEGETDAAFAKALLAERIGRLIESAGGGGIADLLTGQGLREAGLIGLMRLAALAPPGEAEARALAAAIGRDETLGTAGAAALRAEALAAVARLDEIRSDPLPALGMAAEALPPNVRTRPAEALIDVKATQEAVTGAFLAAARRDLSGCAESPAVPPAPVILSFTKNPAGLVLTHQVEEALARLYDRACLTEATRRAAVLALTVQAAREGEALPAGLPQAWEGSGNLADPFTGEPFLYLPDRGILVSAGRDREHDAEPGRSPFEDEEPAYPLVMQGP